MNGVNIANGTGDSLTYVGKREDEDWFRKITLNDPPQTHQEIYRRLVENIGIFRWQNAHGFRTGQHRGLLHLRQKYMNIKELSYFNKNQFCFPLLFKCECCTQRSIE